MVVDDPGDIALGHVGQRDEVALKEAQAIVVVANVERSAHMRGKHAHEAERAGVHAGTHAIEYGAVELETPVLVGKALQVARAHGVIARVEDLELHDLLAPLPKPFDHVGERTAVDSEHAHAALNARVECGRVGSHERYERSRCIRVARTPVIGARRRIVWFQGSSAHDWAVMRSMADTTRSIWACGVDAPAVIPTRRAPSNQDRSSSAASSI